MTSAYCMHGGIEPTNVKHVMASTIYLVQENVRHSIRSHVRFPKVFANVFSIVNMYLMVNPVGM